MEIVQPARAILWRGGTPPRVQVRLQCECGSGKRQIFPLAFTGARHYCGRCGAVAVQPAPKHNQSVEVWGTASTAQVLSMLDKALHTREAKSPAIQLALRVAVARIELLQSAILEREEEELGEFPKDSGTPQGSVDPTRQSIPQHDESARAFLRGGAGAQKTQAPRSGALGTGTGTQAGSVAAVER